MADCGPMPGVDPVLPDATGRFRAIKSRTFQKRIFGNVSTCLQEHDSHHEPLAASRLRLRGAGRAIPAARLDANPYFSASIASISSMILFMRATSAS